MSAHQSKIQNMYDIMGYYGGSQGCTLLYDNDAGNIAAVKGAGFATEQVETCVSAPFLRPAASDPQPAVFHRRANALQEALPDGQHRGRRRDQQTRSMLSTSKSTEGCSHVMARSNLVTVLDGPALTTVRSVYKGLEQPFRVALPADEARKGMQACDLHSSVGPPAVKSSLHASSKVW
jgi:hypothetical protein